MDEQKYFTDERAMLIGHINRELNELVRESDFAYHKWQREEITTALFNSTAQRIAARREVLLSRLTQYITPSHPYR